MKDILNQIFRAEILTEAEAEHALKLIVAGEISAEEIGAFLGALRMRGEKPQEIAGFAKALRSQMIQVNLPGPTLDTCGTGGDGGNTFNISTAVSLIMAALEVNVVKHGNRAISSRSGSADIIEKLGLPLQQSSEAVKKAIEETHFGFCFAPAFHPTLKSVAAIRRNLEVRTVFNLLGPLCNPGKVTHQILGVYSPQLTETLAKALKALGTEAAMVVSSLDGLDEISLSGVTQVSELRAGEITNYTLTPEDAGLQTQPMKDVKGGSAEENLQIILDIFAGKKGAPRDIVVLNAAAALKVVGKVPDLIQGVKMAEEALDQGKVSLKLKQVRATLCPAS